MSCGTLELCRDHFDFAYEAVTLYGTPFQVLRLSKSVGYAVLNPVYISTNGLGSFPFARRYFGNRSYFLFLRLLRCFSSPGSPHYTIDSCNDTAYYYTVRSRIRTSADLCSLTAPRSFSQLATSFFGAWYLGILRMLFVA